MTLLYADLMYLMRRRAELVVAALDMALARRRPAAAPSVRCAMCRALGWLMSKWLNGGPVPRIIGKIGGGCTGRGDGQVEEGRD